MKQTKLELLEYLILIAIIILAIGGVALYEKISCDAKTRDIGYEHRWSAFGGCQIEVLPSQWIPLESYYFKQE